MSGGAAAFLDRVASLDRSGAAARQFDRLLRKPVPVSDPAWRAALFDALVRQLLRAYGLPASAGASYWEWSPLFRLDREIDPHYFTPRDIGDRLAACPPILPETREALKEILTRYFTWHRQGFRLSDGLPLLDGEETLRWAALFPPDLAWLSLDVLRTAGLHPLGSAGAWRAWRRFSAGDFAAKPQASSLREWTEACERGTGPSPVGAQRRAFLAAAFAGEWAALGLDGTCGITPDCGNCPLQGECAWGSKARPEPQSPQEALALLRRDGAAALSTGRLWQVLFSLSSAAGEKLRERMERTPLRALAAQSLAELEQWLRNEGLGGDPPDGCQLQPERVQALFELARRFSDERLVAGETFRGAQDVFNHFRMRLRDAKQEHFFLLLLDSRRRFQSEVAIGQGTMDRALVHPRDVFGAAVRERAGAVLIVHNHPSGDPSPSPEDINVTRRLAEAGALIGIPLLDHIVIGEGRYFSLAEKGLMPA